MVAGWRQLGKDMSPAVIGLLHFSVMPDGIGLARFQNFQDFRDFQDFHDFHDFHDFQDL